MKNMDDTKANKGLGMSRKSTAEKADRAKRSRANASMASKCLVLQCQWPPKYTIHDEDKSIPSLSKCTVKFCELDEGH